VTEIAFQRLALVGWARVFTLASFQYRAEYDSVIPGAELKGFFGRPGLAEAARWGWRIVNLLGITRDFVNRYWAATTAAVGYLKLVLLLLRWRSHSRGRSREIEYPSVWGRREFASSRLHELRAMRRDSASTA